MEKESFEGIRPVDTGTQYGGSYQFDEHDKKILKALNHDARKSLADLSKQVGLSRDAIRNRIQKMVKFGVIDSFRPDINPPKMGFPVINYVFISFQNPSVEMEEKFIGHVKKHPNITYLASLIGKWDYVLYIFCRNPGEFDGIMKGIRRKFPTLIKDYEVYGVLNEFKSNDIGNLLYT